MKKTITLLVLFACINSIAQNRRIDSLLNLIKNETADTNRVKHLHRLCMEYELVGDFEKALEDEQRALSLAQKLKWKDGESKVYNSLGVIYTYTGNYPEALKNYFASLKACEAIKDKAGIASAYSNIGVVYDNQGNYPESLKNNFAALKIQEEIQDKNGIANSYNNIANIYLVEKKYAEALKNYLSSLKIFKEISDKQGIAASYNNIGIVYEYKDDYAEALKNYFASLRIREEIQDKQGIASSYNNIGNIYNKQGKYKEAVTAQTSSLKLQEEIGDKSGMATSLVNLGIAYTKSHEIKKAEEYLNKALSISISIGSKRWIRDSYAGLAFLDSTKGNYKAAFEDHKLYVIYRDSLDNEETQRKSLQSTLQYEFDKKEIAAKAKQDRIDALSNEEKKKQQFVIYAVAGVLLLVVIFSGLLYKRFRITNKQKQIIEAKNKETEEQKQIIEEKHKEITDSINYAERIQRSFLATKELLDENLKNYFVLFQPKDVVSGDFYWASKLNNGTFALVTADSTGHGVPGAIMSILNISSLEKAIYEGLTRPAEILNHTRVNIIDRLKKDGSLEGGKDGMDASLVCFDFANNKFTYAAGNNPVWVVRENNLIELAPDKMPVGKHDKDNIPFTQHEFTIQKGDVIYVLTDGLPDQFGGPKGKKFMYKQLKELLVTISVEPVNIQKQKLEQALKEWKGDLEQVDDVCLIGVRI
jgi:serine phosphatase RsbU (regulator of sigma subunit)/tetratricopeptide (TPR) repeat protein